MPISYCKFLAVCFNIFAYACRICAAYVRQLLHFEVNCANILEYI